MDYLEQLYEAIHEVKQRPLTLGRAEELTVYADAVCALKKLGHHEETHEFTEEDAKDWTARMVNEDGTHGAHWTKEQASQVATVAGVDVKPCVWWAVLNMVYSDYYSVAVKYNLDRPEFYSDLAKAFLMDQDAGTPEEKTAAYFRYVAG